MSVFYLFVVNQSLRKGRMIVKYITTIREGDIYYPKHELADRGYGPRPKCCVLGDYLIGKVFFLSRHGEEPHLYMERIESDSIFEEKVYCCPHCGEDFELVQEEIIKEVLVTHEVTEWVKEEK